MRERRSASKGGRQRRGATADSATQEDQCHPRKIFIGGLAHKTTTQHLRDYFLRFGAIVDAVVLRWPDGRSRGFGYVTFTDASAASAALRGAHAVGGRQVDVKRAVPGTNKLFVGGLPQNTAAAELREHFETFGVVSDAVVMIDPTTSRSRGFGFVCFLPGQEGAAAVAAALEQYDNHRIRGKWIEVKSAAPPHKLAASQGSETPPEMLHVGPQGEEWSQPPSPPTSLPPEKQRGQRPRSLSPLPKLLPKLLGPQQPTLGEPRKVALPAAAEAAAAAAAVVIGSPPGLGMTPRSKAMGNFPQLDPQCGHAAFKGGIPWLRDDGSGPGPNDFWYGGRSLNASLAEMQYKAYTGQMAPPSLPRMMGDQWDAPVGPPQTNGGTGGLQSASLGLQKSLEQLLKLQSCRLEGTC